MDTRQQAIQQSLNNFEQIQSGLNPGREANWFNDYWNKGFQLGRFQEKDDFFKPVAQFANWAAENIIEAPLSAPGTLYQGGVDISQGKYYSGTGKILKGGLDLISFLPPVRGAKTLSTIAKGGSTGLGKSVLKEAGIGAGFGTGYGLAEGLIQAQDLPQEQRFERIISEAGLQGGIGGLIGGAIPLAGAGINRTLRFFNKEVPSLGKTSARADEISNSIENFKTKIDTGATKVESSLIKPVLSQIETPKVEIPTLKVEATTTKAKTIKS
jgi:hypothetical protein